MAYLLRSELEIGYVVLAVVGGSAILNFALYALQPRLARAVVFASPAIGLASWTALIAATKGVASPFIAGLWLEIILSSMIFPPAGIVVVTGGCLLALIGQQAFLGFYGAQLVLTLELGFVAAMGTVSAALRMRSLRSEARMVEEQQALGARVVRLEGEVEGERALGRVGENVGRLAHRLKNAVHSLHGFASLIEPNLAEAGKPALAGLRAAIDDLEELARLTLEEGSDLRAGEPEASQAAEAIHAALREARDTSPKVRWLVDGSDELPAVTVPASDIYEVVQILLRNAIEAMNGEGEGELEFGSRDGDVVVRVRDHGPGLPPGDAEALFRAGYTTKADGSGYGLFLARRVLRRHGGRLEARSASTGGAVFEAVLPTVELQTDASAPGQAENS
jgi:signal transduction histidine kinase